MTNSGPLAYSVKETCALLGLGKTRIYQLINSGELQVKHVGRRTLVLAESIRALVTPAN